MALVIEEWQWDDENLAKLAAHGLTRRVVREVAQGEPRFRRNKKGRAASHQMIGPDEGGGMWVVCIVQVPGANGLWRAITGWEARPHEKEWHRRSA